MKISIKDYDDTTWFIVAIKDEFISATKNILYIEEPGKITAAMATQWLIDNYQVNEIINVGTAGGNPNKVEKNKIYKIGSVLDRDFKISSCVEPSIILDDTTKIICATGDSFVTDWTGLTYDMVDMESYAIAKVCASSENNIKFDCYKYISDTGDDVEWYDSLKKCNEAFNIQFK